jgi:hypothetical protein
MRSKLSALTALKWTADQRDAVRRESTSRYDWADIAQRTLEAYDEVLGRKRNEVRDLRTAPALISGQRPLYGAPMTAGYGLVSSLNDNLAKPLAGSSVARIDLK